MSIVPDEHSLLGSPASDSAGERAPLLRGTELPKPTKKPFYRARPLWLVPFAIIASLVRGMTMAPRVEVFTQLACAAIHHHTYNHTGSLPTVLPEEHLLSLYSSFDPLGPQAPIHPAISRQTHVYIDPSSDDDGGEDDPRKLPSPQCISDPAVQAGAARLQTIMTTVMGTLSAFSTGWWGHFSERHGRTRVLAVATIGWLLTDTTFILVATPGSPFAAHHHKLLVIAPIIEGFLGGWSTLQSATSAYVSDCTSPGSRATIFSRFNGVFFLGFSIGPMIGGWIIKNGIPGIDRIGTVTKEGKSVTEVFWLAISLSFINFLLLAFLFPESLSEEKRAKASLEYLGHGKGKGRAVSDDASGDDPSQTSTANAKAGFIRGVFSPLALFLPVVVSDNTGNGIRKKKDWSLTFLALSTLLYMLSTGIFQIKYLYAVHVYSWGADKLSYYISYLGGLRAIALLFLLPMVISSFKPKPKLAKSNAAANGNKQVKKPKLTISHLANEIHFDLLLTRCCLFVDILSHFLVAVFPAPALVHHMLFSEDASGSGSWAQDTTTKSTVLFVFASGLSSLGSGFIPAVQSLALCIVQARQLLEGSADAAADRPAEDSEAGADAGTKGDSGIGRLFGALSVLQAAGQMIVGPLLFGVIYSNTVADFPKAIFVMGGSILTAALVCGLLVRSPVERERVENKGRGKGKDKRVVKQERGRSRVSKDLFGTGEGGSGN